MRVLIFTLSSLVFFTSFYSIKADTNNVGQLISRGFAKNAQSLTLVPAPSNIDVAPVPEPAPLPVITTGTSAEAFVNYARNFIGIPYVYGSVNPAVGFDCSGFINHVAKHFGLNVPRSSVEYTNFGTEVMLSNAVAGDLILFTGTDPSTRVVGHMGIITSSSPEKLEFIHSSSGKANGVTISELEGYYETRFVKVVRILS